MPKTKVKGQMVQAGELGQTDTQTDGRTDATNYIISLASRSIKTCWHIYLISFYSLGAWDKFLRLLRLYRFTGVWSKWKFGQRSIGALSAGPATLWINTLRLGQFDVSYWPWFFVRPPRNRPCIPTYENLKHEVWFFSAVKLYLWAEMSYIAHMGTFTAVIVCGSWIDHLLIVYAWIYIKINGLESIAVINSCKPAATFYPAGSQEIGIFTEVIACASWIDHL